MITIVEQLRRYWTSLLSSGACAALCVLCGVGLAWLGLDCGEEVDWLLDNQDV